MKSKQSGSIVYYNKKNGVGLVCDKTMEHQYFFMEKKKKFKHGDEVEFNLEESQLNGLLGTKKWLQKTYIK